MSLTLHIVSQQARAMGAAASFQCDENGATIGRVDGNNWILPDAERFVSSRHASITNEAGMWYLTDVSTNGTYVNDPGFLIGNGHTVPLNDGDKLFLGDYEILVSVTSATTTGAHTGSITGAAQTGPASGLFDSPPIDPSIPGAGSNLDPLAAIMGDSNDPFDMSPSSVPAAPHITTPPEINDNQDPLALFDSPDLVDEDSTPPDDWLDDRGAQENHGSPLQQNYVPPRASNNQIPDDWDKTHMPGMSPQPTPVAQPDPVPPPVAPPAAAIPDYTTPPQQTVPPPQPVAPQAPPPQQAPPAATGQYPQRTGVFRAPEPTVQQPAIEVDAGSAEGLRRFLTAAGIDPERMPPQAANAVFQLAGSVFREVVQGLMEVLRARDELKSELRIARTVIQSAKNNPLKFSVSTDEALTKLLFPQEHGYMAPVEALNEAIDDIKAHQLAMTAGLSAALSSIMEQFDPEELEDQFQKTLKHSPLAALRGKSKYWEMYQDLYKELAGDSGSNILALYGEDFATAYQEQIDKLS